MRLRSQRVKVVCPHCRNTQRESAKAVSTFCRSCGQHFELGPKAAAIAPAPRGPLTSSSDLWNGDVVLAPEEQFGDSAGWLGTAPPDRRTAPASRNVSRPTADLNASKVAVNCFDCGHEQEVPEAATSSLCIACGAYISLRDVHVRNDSRQRIRTRGDIIVHREASLNGGNLICRNLKAIGRVSGSIDCTRTASFFGPSRLLGVLTTAGLAIEDGANVEFLQPVYAREVVVRGVVTGDIYCSGHLHVAGGGVLRGEVFARSMTVDEGGSIDARLRICFSDVSLSGAGSPERAPGAPPASGRRPELVSLPTPGSEEEEAPMEQGLAG